MTIRSHTLSSAPGVTRAITRYFGVDLARIPQLSDGELAGIADRAQEMQRLMKVLPILQKHLDTLISGQMAYEDFVRQVLKDGEKVSKKIDKAMLDAYLMDRGYLQHQQVLQQRLGLETQKQDLQLQGQLKLGRMDMAAWLRLFHARQQNQTRQIQQKVPDGIRQMQLAEQQRREEKQWMDLITYGNRGNPKHPRPQGNSTSSGNRLARFFTGG